MIKISAKHTTETETTLLLEGRVVNSWVELVASTCEEALGRGRQLTLDLKGVTFVDGKGAALIHSLMARRVGITNCSGFITEQLKNHATARLWH